MSTDERFLRLLFDGAPDGIFVADADGRYTDVNAAGCRLLGCTRDDLVGRSLSDFVAPAELGRQEALKRRLLEGRAEVSEWRLRRRDGTYVPVELSAVALPNGSLLGFVRDITERLEADEALRFSEAKFSGIVSISADAVVTIDDAQRMTFFNEGAERIFGHSKADVLGLPLEVLIPQRFRATHRQHVQRFAEGADTARLMGTRKSVIWGVRKNGDEFPLDASISKLAIGDRRLFTVMLRDVSERKRNEDEQRLLAEVGQIIADAGPDYRRLLSEVADAVVHDIAECCSLDIVQEGDVLRLRVAHADPAKLETCAALERRPLHGGNHPVLGALGTTGSRLVSDVTPEYLETIADDCEHLRLLRSLDLGSFVVVPLVAREKALGTLMIGCSRRSRRYGAEDVARAERLAGRMALAVDNARLHEALERALQARDNVLGIVAHDLRSPLNAIMLSAELIGRRSSGLEPQDRQPIEGIRRVAARMDRLVQDLLDVARVEGGRGLSIHRSLVRPLAILAEVIEQQQATLLESSRTVTVEAQAVTPAIWADGARLAQVLDNLLGNAIKFSRRHITVGVAPTGSEVLIWVADDGDGISESDRPHLFDRFWQAAAMADRRGAGLGLSIVKGIVEAHGGRIWVESEAGSGTTFYFTLPVEPQAECKQTAHLRDPPRGSGSRLSGVGELASSGDQPCSRDPDSRSR